MGLVFVHVQRYWLLSSPDLNPDHELILIFFPYPNFRLALLHGELNVGKKTSPEFMLMFKKDYASLITLPDVD